MKRPCGLSVAKFFKRYVDNILRTIKKSEIPDVLAIVNNIHPNMKFTMEEEEDGRIVFLCMLVHRQNGKCDTKWYLKPTNTGLCLSFYAVAPTRYKRNIVEGMIRRIDSTTSNWLNFSEGLEKAKKSGRQTSTLQASMNRL